jgi:hypothetical protein
MVRFLYTDSVKEIDLHAIELLGAANKYNLPKLKMLSEVSIR